MDGIREFLEEVRQHDLARGHLRGLFHIAIGRRISKATGEVVSSGVTWRQLSAVLKTVRFDKDLVSELGADPETLSPRDRERFWYSAIALARVDSPAARAEADRLAARLKPLGYVISPPPSASEPPPPPPPPPPPHPAPGGAKKKKKK